MAPSGVVPAFDVVKHSPAGLDRRAEPLAIEQLTLECREETLAQGIVIGIADGAHRRPDAETQTALAVGEGCVLGEFNRSSQHLPRGGCDDDTEAAFGAGRTSETILAWPPLGASA